MSIATGTASAGEHDSTGLYSGAGHHYAVMQRRRYAPGHPKAWQLWQRHQQDPTIGYTAGE